jgi:hypothetical protein
MVKFWSLFVSQTSEIVARRKRFCASLFFVFWSALLR